MGICYGQRLGLLGGRGRWQLKPGGSGLGRQAEGYGTCCGPQEHQPAQIGVVRHIRGSSEGCEHMRHEF